MMSLTFGLFTQVSGSGPLGPLVFDLSAPDKGYSHKLVMGDFNFKEINWWDMNTTVSELQIASQFLECVRDSYLFQHVHPWSS